MQLLTLDFLGISESLQTGDIAYYASNSNMQGGFKVISDLTAFGTVVDINRQNGKITVLWDDSDNDNDGSPDITAPQQGDYIMFGKSNAANSSSLLGYYAEIKFVNNSHEKAELFSIGSELEESSR
tara:strand:- start:12012 stop:12389 length:378 start_codon:yes stop_codon:yes gene_type:complete